MVNFLKVSHVIFERSETISRSGEKHFSAENVESKDRSVGRKQRNLPYSRKIELGRELKQFDQIRQAETCYRNAGMP